jgi:hypothetical protein
MFDTLFDMGMIEWVGDSPIPLIEVIETEDSDDA